MLAWIRSFGSLRRVGIELIGSYGAGLLRFLQRAGIEMLEVTTPDAQDRRRRGKTDDFDPQSAAHAAFAGIRTVTPRTRDGMVESLRVLSACRKTAVAARRIALQMIHNTIVCTPDALRETLRHRLNRGDDRAANSAPHIIAIGRLRTEAYEAHRIAEGHSKLEAIRCLRRYISREVFMLITRRQKAVSQTRIAA